MNDRMQVVVDLSGVRGPEELQELLAEAFAFPGYYGRNWDAFHDCITSLDPMPKKIVVRGFNELSAHLPRDAKIMEEIMQEFRTAPDLTHVELSIT
jgi:ribonuclease inhibitor